jgi:hypothetical protein
VPRGLVLIVREVRQLATLYYNLKLIQSLSGAPLLGRLLAYPQTLDKAEKARQRRTLKVITNICKLPKKKMFYNIWP